MGDLRIRAAAFEWLSEQVAKHGDVLQRDLLSQGFHYQGQRVPLVSPQGIFKPRVLQDMPLSITTAPGSPYNDSFDANGLLRYRYRGTDPNHRDNVGLRLAWQRRVPLVYFHGIAPNRYLAAWPVYIVADNPKELYVTVVVDEHASEGFTRDGEAAYQYGTAADIVSEPRRAYGTVDVRVRLHQRLFRERVLAAYRRQCAFCRFKHEELLDAAHIVPDADPYGEPVVQNGLALCSLHHRAFDRHFIGVTPDFRLEVRPDILLESDGPTLKHGLQALHGQKIIIPRVTSLQPDKDLLTRRYAQFLAAI